MWNQWGAQASTTPGFQATAYPPAPPASTTAAPPPGGFPMGYPFYPTSAMPPSAAAMPGYTAQQWSMPQQQQWQQWEQWQQQYSQWQQQYGDKYQAQMMMGGGAGMPPLPAQGDASVNPPLPGDMKDQLNKDADGFSSTTNYSQGAMQASETSGKRPHDSTSEGINSPQQANKKARESNEEPSEAEKAFDTQFKNWEEQFLKWKEQNSDHPDKNQYKEYEAKWESWREQLMQRREQMRKKRESKTVDDSKAPPAPNDVTVEQKATTSIPPVQKQMPPSVSIPPMQSANPNSLAMQGMAFPPFSNPPPIVQNPMVQPAMGFPGFGNQPYPSFPTQPPGYGMPPPFQAQPLYPGMNMMCPPPAIVNPNPNAPDLLSSAISQPPPVKKDSATTGNQADKSQDMSNFLNKSEGGSKGIPGLDLVDGATSGKSSEDNHNQAPPKQLPLNTAPLHTSDDNTPFNFPPPQKPQMGEFTGPVRSSGPGFNSGPGNMLFMGPQNFGPPPGFGSNIRGSFPGSLNQPPQNKFGPNNTQGPPPQFGKNFQQQSRPFFDKDKNQQAFGSQQGIPKLMDGFDPSKGPPSFPKDFGRNQDDSDYQDKNEDTYRDQGEDDYNDYDEYDGSRFENPWDRENNDENHDDKFKEPDFNKTFGNQSDGQNSFNKQGFGLKKDIPFGGSINRRNMNERFPDSLPQEDRFASQEPDNKFLNLRGSGNKFDRFAESRGLEGNGKGMDDRTSRFSGPPSDGPGGRGFGRENKGSRFDAPFEDKRFGGSRFGPVGQNSPHDQDVDNTEGSRDIQSGLNVPGDIFGRGKFANQNKGFPGSRGNSDRFSGSSHFDGPNDRLVGPGNRFGGPDERFGGPGGFDGPRGVRGNVDDSGRFNGPDSRFPTGGRGSRDFNSPGDEGPGFGRERFGGRKDIPFERKEDIADPPNQGRPKGLLPHPMVDRDKIPSLMSLGKLPLLPLPGRAGGSGPAGVPEDNFPSGKPDLDDRRNDGPGGPSGRRNEPIAPLIPTKEGGTGGSIPPFSHELKKHWEAPPPTEASAVDLNTSVIDYDHKPLGGESIYGDLNEPESLEPMQVFDYNHGANPGPLRRDFLEDDDDCRGNPDRGPRGRDRGRDERDRFGPRGRNWEDDRNRRERGDRSDDRLRDRDWSGKRGERDEKRDRDRIDRDSRDDKKDRDRGDKDKNEKDRDRSDREKREKDRDFNDRRDGRRDEKDNKDNRSSGQTGRGGPRDRNQHDNKSKEDKPSVKNEKLNTKIDEPSQKPTVDQKPQHSPAVLIEDILNNPGRNSRPAKIVVILRGPPGSGKTFVAKLIKDKEVEMGGSAPRILSLDDYFMVEIEKEETDAESGRTIKNKIMEYEYEAGMESSYRHSLIKAFRKTILDGYFPFIIIDCVHEKLQHYEEIYSFAKQKGFQVYICEMDKDLSSCSKRNIHKRTEKEIEGIIKNWESTPPTQMILDVRSLLQSAAITEVDMEDSTEEANPEDKKEEDKKEEIGQTSETSKEEKSKKCEEEGDRALFTSKWDTMEFSGEKLDRLDGLVKARKTSDNIRDWLQLPEDYYELSGSKLSSKGKRVRWADLEERRQQEKMRAIGFVVGQTDWSRMMDPTFGGDKLTQTKYI